jgi:hypothetical protein
MGFTIRITCIAYLILMKVQLNKLIYFSVSGVHSKQKKKPQIVSTNEIPNPNQRRCTLCGI